jgi:hypothetical protein
MSSDRPPASHETPQGAAQTAQVVLSGDLLTCRGCGKTHALSRRGNRDAELRAFAEIHADCELP